MQFKVVLKYTATKTQTTVALTFISGIPHLGESLLAVTPADEQHSASQGSTATLDTPIPKGTQIPKHRHRLFTEKPQMGQARGSVTFVPGCSTPPSSNRATGASRPRRYRSPHAAGPARRRGSGSCRGVLGGGTDHFSASSGRGEERGLRGEGVSLPADLRYTTHLSQLGG